MSCTEVHIAPSQPSGSAPEQSNNAGSDTDSVITSEGQPVVVHPDITEENIAQKKTFILNNLDASYVSVDISDSTCTCSTPSSCTCSTQKHKAYAQSACDHDCNPTINNDNDNIRNKKCGRTFGLSECVVGILFSSLLFIYVLVIIYMTVEASIPTILFWAAVTVMAVNVLYIDYIRNKQTCSDVYNDSRSIRCNDRDDIPTNDSAPTTKNYTGKLLVLNKLHLGFFLYLSFAHKHVMFSTSIIISFFAVAVVGVPYPGHNYWIVSVCGCMLVLRTLVYTHMHPKMEAKSDCPCCQCYFGNISFYMIPGIVFTLVGYLFEAETIVMLLCGCTMIGIGLLCGFHRLVIGQAKTPSKYEFSIACHYKLVLFFIYILVICIMDADPKNFPLILVIALLVGFVLCIEWIVEAGYDDTGLPYLYLTWNDPS